MSVLSNIEIKAKGFLRTALSAEASTAVIDVDFVNEDDPATHIDLQADTLMFEIDPLNKTGKGSEIILATSRTSDSPVTNRTRLATVTRGIAKYGAGQTGSASLARSWDEGTEVAVATGTMAKMVNLIMSYLTTNPSNTTFSGTLTFSGADTFTGSFRFPVYADATARDAAIPSPTNGMVAYLTDGAVLNQYIGGAWTTFATGTVAAAADHTAGKVDIASASEIGAGTAADATSGAINVIPVSQTAKTSGAVTPAFLTGGTGAQSTAATWAGVTDGSFGITINGTAYNVDAINFTGNADMAAVAATIQAKIRTATGALETCVWSTDHFVISSVLTTQSSAITVTRTSTGTVGTDISGAGASDWMDCDTGNGTVTAYVSLDENKLPIIGSTGTLAVGFMPSNLQEGNTFFGATDITGAEAENLSDGTDASLKHVHDQVINGRLSTRKFLPMSNAVLTAASGTAADYGGYFDLTTQAANNAFACATLGHWASLHDKTPKFITTVKFVAATAQDGFIGICDNSFTGTTLEDSAMTMDHLGFIIQDGTLFISVADGSTQSKLDISATVADVTLIHTYCATFDGTTATFYVDGASVGTRTANVPNSNLIQFRVCDAADASGAAKNIFVSASGGVSFA